MTNDTREQMLTRQSDLITAEQLKQKVVIIGAGAIGSWTALCLAKMGIQDITVFDDDEVSIENMNCQFFPLAAIGRGKAAALAEMVQQFTGVFIEAVPYRYQGEEPLKGLVIAAVDSMSARAAIYGANKGNQAVPYIIDPRMGAEQAQMYVMSPSDTADQASYEKTLYSDDAAVVERCTAKSTIYTANLLAGSVAKAVKDIITGNKYQRVMQWSIADNQQLSWLREQHTNK